MRLTVYSLIEMHLTVHSFIVDTNGLKNKHVKGVIDACFGVAWAEIKKNDNFKLDGMLNLRLKKTPTNPVAKEQTDYLLPLRIRPHS